MQKQVFSLRLVWLELIKSVVLKLKQQQDNMTLICKPTGEMELHIKGKHSYEQKGGNGVASCCAFANTTTMMLYLIGLEIYNGKVELAAPECVNPGEVVSFVFRKKDMSLKGSKAVLTYGVGSATTPFCKIALGFDSPYDGDNHIGVTITGPGQLITTPENVCRTSTNFMTADPIDVPFTTVARIESSKI